MLYRTKPFEIEAVRYVSTLSAQEIRTAFPDIEFEFHNGDALVWDHLQFTWVRVNKGDYIIRGMKGEYYPCAPDVFETKYEAVEDACD